jgi:hypothetical protein
MLRLVPLLLLLAAPAAAQPLDFERQITPFPVLDASGDPFDLPFAGAFNSPRTQLADVDGDDDLDLFLLEEQGRILYYENVGGEGGYEFAWRSDQYGEIDAGSWFRFGDLDSDGDLDLLTQLASGRVRYYENTGTATDPALTVAAEPLLDTAGDPVNPEDPNVPALADIDGDGGLDLFLGRADSGKIRWYRHTGVEGGVPQYEFAGEEFQDIVIFESNPTCGSGAAQDPIYITPGRSGDPGSGNQDGAAFGGGRPSLHGQNALAFADADGDGDLDLFWGDFFTPSLYFFRNEGTPTEPEMVLVSEEYPLDNPLTTAGYNVPSFGDLDADGDLDLVLGIVGGFCSTTANIVDNLYLLENIGTPAAPDFVERTSRLIDAVDVGRASYPAFYDFDGDGDLDLLVGSGYNPRPDGPQRGSLYLFENTGTATMPEYRLAADDYLALDIDFANHYAPAFGDLTGDGLRDLLVGTFGGKLGVLLNTGDGFDLVTDSDGDFVPLQDLDVGSTATPTLGDLDADGDLDLLVGEFSGPLNYFRNDGSAQVPNFVETPITGLGLEEGFDVGRFSAPHLADLDGDGDLDLLVGTETEDILFFRNVGTATEPQFEQEPLETGTLRYNTAPVVADVDGDGDLDLLSGDLAGGLLYLDNRQVTTSGAAPPPPQGSGGRIESYPNPFGEATTLRVSGGDEPLTLTLFDAVGRALRSWKLRARDAAQIVDWDGTAASGAPVPSGVYVAQLSDGERVLATQKLMRLR